MGESENERESPRLSYFFRSATHAMDNQLVLMRDELRELRLCECASSTAKSLYVCVSVVAVLCSLCPFMPACACSRRQPVDARATGQSWPTPTF